MWSRLFIDISSVEEQVLQVLWKSILTRLHRQQNWTYSAAETELTEIDCKIRSVCKTKLIISGKQPSTLVKMWQLCKQSTNKYHQCSYKTEKLQSSLSSDKINRLKLLMLFWLLTYYYYIIRWLNYRLMPKIRAFCINKRSCAVNLVHFCPARSVSMSNFGVIM